MQRNDLHAVQLVPLTAFDREGRLHLDTMRQQTERLLAAGVRVFIPCAGSSEFHTLRTDEIVSAVAMTREVVGDQARVIVPVGFGLEMARELAKRAIDEGADAMLIMPLNFPYLSDAGARDYYLGLLDVVSCPTVVYKKDVLPSSDLLCDLGQHPNMIGVKYALPDVTAFSAIVQQDGGRLDWFCGHAERFAPFFMMAGAPGYTSGAGNLCPRLTLAMHQALAGGDYQEGMRLMNIIRPIEDYRARDNHSYNVSFLKSAIRHLGMDFGEPRPPYRRLTEAEHDEIESMIQPILRAEAELS